MIWVNLAIERYRKAGFRIEFPHPNASRITPSDLSYRNRRPESEKTSRKNAAFIPMGCDPKPDTWEGYCEAARKAVKIHLAGETKARACQRAGLSESLGTGITHVIDKTPLFLALKAGVKPDADTPRHVVSFIRWHEGITCPSRIHGDDTEQLRERLKQGGYSLVNLVAASGVHSTTIQKFRSGSVKGMRPDTRSKLWEALGGDK